MNDGADPDEQALEALWLARFGQPPPIRGCAELALALLAAAAAGEAQ